MNTNPFNAAARKLALPLEVIALSNSAVKESYERSWVLVRPDGHVAWRGNSLPANPADIIDQVRGAHRRPQAPTM
jgi:hypothetical protein